MKREDIQNYHFSKQCADITLILFKWIVYTSAGLVKSVIHFAVICITVTEKYFKGLELTRPLLTQLGFLWTLPLLCSFQMSNPRSRLPDREERQFHSAIPILWQVWELVAQLFRASRPNMCCAERPMFKHQTDHLLVISVFHLVILLYQFTPLFCKIFLRTCYWCMETGRLN